MIEENRHGRKTGKNAKNRMEWAQSVEELFSELLVDAQALSPEMKLRFVEARSEERQPDIRQAMADLDTLGNADRLAVSYLLRSLARKGQLTPEQAFSGVFRRERRVRSRLFKPAERPLSIKS